MTSRIFYDFEFIEDGTTIVPISLGMVADDGEELYLINRDAPLRRIAAHEWLPDNVVPHLPLRSAHEEAWRPINTKLGVNDRPAAVAKLTWDIGHPDYVFLTPRDGIRERVHEFVMLRHEPELWAWYAAYDHVALAQLFGRMVDLPSGFPQHTNDLRQEVGRLGLTQLPPHTGTQHHALADARWNQMLHTRLGLLGHAELSERGGAA